MKEEARKRVPTFRSTLQAFEDRHSFAPLVSRLCISIVNMIPRYCQARYVHALRRVSINARQRLPVLWGKYIRTCKRILAVHTRRCAGVYAIVADFFPSKRRASDPYMVTVRRLAYALQRVTHPTCSPVSTRIALLLALHRHVKCTPCVLACVCTQSRIPAIIYEFRCIICLQMYSFP